RPDGVPDSVRGRVPVRAPRSRRPLDLRLRVDPEDDSLPLCPPAADAARPVRQQHRRRVRLRAPEAPATGAANACARGRDGMRGPGVLGHRSRRVGPCTSEAPRSGGTAHERLPRAIGLQVPPGDALDDVPSPIIDGEVELRRALRVAVATLLPACMLAASSTATGDSFTPVALKLSL